MTNKFLTNLLVISTLFISTALSFSAQSVESPTKILVSPNILVTRQDSDLPHAETIIAVNPKDNKNLLGSAIVFTRDERGNANKLYASKDGGQTWTQSEFPELGSVDPQVAFGITGTAYFHTLGENGFFIARLTAASVGKKADRQALLTIRNWRLI